MVGLPPKVDRAETCCCTDSFRLQVGGFLQRLDYVRKYAFGVICILKNEQGQFPIRCPAPPHPSAFLSLH